MANGYAGKLLVVDLTKRNVSTLNTEDYKEWGGGHGIGSAVFFELCKNKAIDALDPGNVVSVMTGPIQGTVTPYGSGRAEVQGIGAQGYPTNWFTRSGFGGRFAGQLKFAGWDGVFVTGKADKPVWIDIRDQNVAIRDASATGDALWGLDTTEVEEKIYELVRSDDLVGWTQYGGSRDSGRSALNPGVLSCGPAGENLIRNASLNHEGGGGAGQGGFGAVFGSKNLKSISVIGTGTLTIADPKALMDARAWAQKTMWDIADLKPTFAGVYTMRPSLGMGGAAADVGIRGDACLGCFKACHGGKNAEGTAPNSSCFDGWYTALSPAVAPHADGKGAAAADRMQRLGINAWDLTLAVPWLVGLWKKGIVGPGKQIDSNLPWDQVGTDAFNKAFLEAIAYRTDIVAVLAEGTARAAEKWGRYEEDTTSGQLALCAHGYSHHYDARNEVEWGFGTMLGDRDINDHDFTLIEYWYNSIAPLVGMKYVMTAKEEAEFIGSTLLPYKDPMMCDFSDVGMYSDAMVKTVSWHRAYTRFWKQSGIYCDWGIADWINPYCEGGNGKTPEIEPKFYNAVTGQNLTFEDGIKIGTKIWNLDRAIWCLHGRTRDGDKLDEWQFVTGAPATDVTYEVPYIMTCFENGEWSYKDVSGRMLNHAKVEDWKTRYYAFEGWDTKTGVPTRATLEKLGLAKVADELAAAKKV